MRYFGLLDENGNVIEEGFCPDNCDFTTAMGRPPKSGDRWIDGQGENEAAAREDARMTVPTEKE